MHCVPIIDESDVIWDILAEVSVAHSPGLPLSENEKKTFQIISQVFFKLLAIHK